MREDLKINVTHEGVFDDGSRRSVKLRYDVQADILAISTSKKKKDGSYSHTGYRIPYRDKKTNNWSVGQGIVKSSSALALSMSPVDSYLLPVKKTTRKK